jgi:hypothetical protein
VRPPARSGRSDRASGCAAAAACAPWALPRRRRRRLPPLTAAPRPQVTQELLFQLEGVPRAPRAAAAEAEARARAADAEAVALARRSAGLRAALARSRRVGDMLLAHEDAELAQVAALAEELLARGGGAPPPRGAPPPCAAEGDACGACYTARGAGAPECGDAVRAYSACARAAAAAAMGAGA